MVIDLRSDTVTKPTPEMHAAMMNASVGDDVFGEDPSVKALEKKCADLLGMEAAVFCPSGTMTNQIGIRILTQPYDEVICYKGSHIYKYEGGGLAGNSLVSVRLLEGDRGRISVKEIETNINNVQDAHQPISSVVALENTVVREAGSYYTLDQIKSISQFARAQGLKMHLDGARLFNALIETKDKAVEYGKYFDTISICLSKGLGAPVGSVLVCKKELEPKARRMRKAFGGGMRQAGFLAAAASYALDNHITRLKEDHVRASELGKTLSHVNWVKSVMPVDTNMVIFSVADHITPEKVLDKLAGYQIKAIKFGDKEIRLVTHLDFDDSMLEKSMEIIKNLSF
ncbi:MAG: aminotransferase class I/II-fold pyridoxal phosphate-dependent enzyme [Cyclobacteriaceae bacterium]|nr:aminotransferase class I/II-fold pyridoxal phosphate-dependent enzyme [Cyclobacteriaceae bacterium]